MPPAGGTRTHGQDEQECRVEGPGRPHLLRDEGAGERDSRPEENPAAEDHLPVEAVTQVAEDGGSHHEAADECCVGRGEPRLWHRGLMAEPSRPDHPARGQAPAEEAAAAREGQPRPDLGPGEVGQALWVRRLHDSILFNAQWQMSPSGTF